MAAGPRSARAVSTIRAPRGCSCMALMASSTRGDVSTDQQRRGFSMTAPEAARGRQTATAGADGQTINHAQQGPPGNAQQRRGPSPTMASTPRATAAAAWPPGSASRPGRRRQLHGRLDQHHAQGRRSAPRGSADRQRAGSVTPGRWIGAGARGDNQHKRR